MAKNNLSLAYSYITDIFNDSISHKDKCNQIIKASLLTVRSFLLCVPFVNRITQFALRILSPELTGEVSSYFGEEELEIRYGTEVLLSDRLQVSQSIDFLNQMRDLFAFFGGLKNLEEFQETLQDPNGVFAELSQEEKQQMQQLFAVFLENPEEFQKEFQDMLSQEEEQFPTFLKNPDGLQEALQNRETFFSPLSEEEQLNLDNWVKEVQLNKNIEGIRAATHIQNGLDELD
ncbi:MAG TPA: hypothetical protein VGZ69_00525 [Candidatus Rhabdochlamydia sp.]|jgi:hypothetical protein|nr:hypothetical protein [Candidatus Rhabdochlamydia sp.]